MMFGKRYTITADLVVQSHLHIGGSDAVAIMENGEKLGEYMPVIRGCSGPIIPAPTLKGVLRCSQEPGEEQTKSFGTGSFHAKDVGKAAKLWLDHAEFTDGPDADSLEGLTSSPCARGLFRAKHMSQNPKTGAALDNHLFEREMVAAGSKFRFQADWLDDSLDGLETVLGALVAGLQFGKGTSKGAGLVALDANTIRVFHHQPDKNGDLKEKPLSQDDLDAFIEKVNQADISLATNTVTLTLAAEGPFISVRPIGNKNGQQNVAEPLEHDGKPVLWPESLAGALRSRARWLAELERAKYPDKHRDTEIPMDDPKLELALGGARKVKSGDLEKLSPVERLFGVTGAKALLTIKSVICEHTGNSESITSNSINRLTGATREGVLFSRRAYWQPVFKAVLEVKDDNACLDTLLGDLEANGIELGNSTTRGFGWFKVKVER